MGGTGNVVIARGLFWRNFLDEEGFAMKRKRFVVEQIVTVLKGAKSDMPLVDLNRRIGLSSDQIPPLEEAMRRAGA